MLMLSRYEDQSILIYPENIPDGMTVAELFENGPMEIIVTETKTSQCKLGFDAPQGLTILREELYQK